MSYFIIVVVVGLVVSPIFWMMPSPRQKRLVKLRQQAMAMGFQVKIGDLPQPHRAKVRKEPVRQGVVYRLPWKQPMKTRQSFHFLVIREELANGRPIDDLRSTAVDRVLNQGLLSMPEQILALECSAAGLGLYWREQGNVDQVALLSDAAQQLQSQLRPLLLKVLG